MADSKKRVEIDVRTTGAQKAEADLRRLGESGDRGLRAIVGGAEAADAALRLLGPVIGRVTVAATAGLALRQLVRAGDELSTSLSRLGSATGNVATAAEVYDRLYAASLRTGAGISDSIAAFTRFSVAARDIGATNDQVLRLISGIQGFGRLAGTSAAEMSAATLQLGQALASGTLQGDELRSILEAGCLDGDQRVDEQAAGDRDPCPDQGRAEAGNAEQRDAAERPAGGRQRGRGDDNGDRERDAHDAAEATAARHDHQPQLDAGPGPHGSPALAWHRPFAAVQGDQRRLGQISRDGIRERLFRELGNRQAGRRNQPDHVATERAWAGKDMDCLLGTMRRRQNGEAHASEPCRNRQTRRVRHIRPSRRSTALSDPSRTCSNQVGLTTRPTWIGLPCSRNWATSPPCGPPACSSCQPWSTQQVRALSLTNVASVSSAWEVCTPAQPPSRAGSVMPNLSASTSRTRP
ncbi:MAG: tape measure protein [Acetobacteraceae bacterium]|nr:tape measure protein [Acetobacteraceae bacterium]